MSRKRKPSFFKRVKRCIRTPFIWFGVGLGWVVLTNLSYRQLLRICDWMSALMYRLDKAGRVKALFNLRVISGVYPPERNWRILHATPPTPREEILMRGSYRNMVRTLGYTFWCSRHPVRRAKEVGEMSEACSNFLRDHRPVVAVSAHIGCWEMLSQQAFLHDHQILSVAKKIGNTAGITRLLMKARTAIGQEIVLAENAVQSLIKALNKRRTIGLLVDQWVPSKRGGVWVRFMGRFICVTPAAGLLAAKSRAPVVVAWSRPLKNGKIRCELLATYEARQARDVWGFTQLCIRNFERVIRRHPSLWILNYTYFREEINPTDLVLLERREKMSREREEREAKNA